MDFPAAGKGEVVTVCWQAHLGRFPSLNMKRVTLEMRVAVHPIKALLWKHRSQITPDMTLREIGKMIGLTQPQQVKHHLEVMVRMGTIDYVKGQYVFPK